MMYHFRYGRESDLAAQAWKTLIPGVLNSTLKETFSLMVDIPNTKRVDNFGYDANDVFDAWDLIVAAAEQDQELGAVDAFR